MQRTLPTQQGSDTNRQAFVTIDDMQELAKQLLSGLNRLGGYRYPLAVRKGIIEEVGSVREGIQIKDADRSYFVDLIETKAGEQYLKITESRYQGKDKPWRRKSIFISSKIAQEFAEAITKLVSKMGDYPST